MSTGTCIPVLTAIFGLNLACTFADDYPSCGSADDCYVAHAEPGCSDSACCKIVCDIDSFCCNTTWDETCVEHALGSCAPPSPCSVAMDAVEGDIAIDTTGSTLDLDLTGICDPGPYGDDFIYNFVAFRFTATATGLCELTTCDQAGFDTRIAVLSSCDPLTVEGCLDDTEGCGGFTTALTIFVEEGLEYIAVVGAYGSAETGTGTLTITSVGPCPGPDPTGDENETCGKDTNGGCNNAEGLVTPIDNGDVLTGTVWADAGVRDTDWFEFTLDTYSRVQFDLYRTGPLWGIIEGVEAACAGYAGAGTCPHVFERCLLPGTYRIAITTPGFDGIPCGSVLGDYSIACTIEPGGCEPNLTWSDPVEYASADGGDGRHYVVARFIDGNATWDVMRTLVEERGGEFGMLQDQEILDYLWPGLLDDPSNWNSCNGPLIGLYQDPEASDYVEPDGGWYWTDGSPVDFAPWLAGEPNDLSGPSRGQLYSACTIAPNLDDVPAGFGGTRFLLSFPSFDDCNENGAPDSWDIGAGVLEDADRDGVPDNCEIYNPYTLSDPATWEGNGHTYLVFSSEAALTWDEARLEAERFGGHLATITDAGESDFVFDSLVDDDQYWANSYYNGGPYLGGLVIDGAIEWVTGEPATYENWWPGEPNGTGTLCMHYFTVDTGPGSTWDDLALPGSKEHFVVEFDKFPDCNENDLPDAYDIAYGISEDTDRDGVPDECGSFCLGDLNLDGQIDGADLTLILGAWGTMDPKYDLNDDGLIDGADLTMILGAWGPCS